MTTRDRFALVTVDGVEYEIDLTDEAIQEASLLDHDAYQSRFAEELEQSGLPKDAVIRTGPWLDRLIAHLSRHS